MTISFRMQKFTDIMGLLLKRPWSLAEFDRSLQARLGASFLQLDIKPTTIDLTLFHATIVGTSILSLQYSAAEWTRMSSKVMRLAFERLVDNSRISPDKNRKTSRL